LARQSLDDDASAIPLPLSSTSWFRNATCGTPGYVAAK